MVLYASILGEVLPDAMGHILTASLINPPGALVSLADTILGLLPHFGGEPVTLRHILGVLSKPSFLARLNLFP
jgi:hypothetical protein